MNTNINKHNHTEAHDFDLVPMLDEMLKMYRPSANKRNIEISLSLCSQHIMVNGDRHRILQVVSNLLTNAIKFTDRGRVSISVSEIETSMASVVPPICSHDRKLRSFEISVRDTGKGLSEEELTQLFHRFSQTTTKVGEGSGRFCFCFVCFFFFCFLFCVCFVCFPPFHSFQIKMSKHIRSRIMDL